MTDDTEPVNEPLPDEDTTKDPADQPTAPPSPKFPAPGDTLPVPE